MAEFLLDRYGENMFPHVQGSANMTDTGADTVLADPGDNRKNVIACIIVTNKHATQDTAVTISDGTDSIVIECAADGGGATIGDGGSPIFVAAPSQGVTATAGDNADIDIFISGWVSGSRG